MACEAVHTGSRFLAATLANLDCQGRTIGAYGYGALADPGSPVAQALTAILTIFIALFGIRLLLGRGMGARDLVDDAIRVGLFLALATSWPAWRVVAYDLVLDGPGQIAAAIGQASALPGSANDLNGKLQEADDGMVALTMYGSGRLTGGISGGSDLGDATGGIALADQTALGSGRATFLATVIGAQGLLRLGAGLLLAVAPLMAGLILFTGTRSMFAGWLRALGFCALGSLAFAVIAGTWLALLYPWLTDVLAQRQSNVLVPSAPTELFVLALAFTLTTGGVLLLIARLMFLPGFGGRVTAVLTDMSTSLRTAQPGSEGLGSAPLVLASRAQILSAAVEATLRREEPGTPARTPNVTLRERGEGSGDTRTGARAAVSGEGRLGETWRRTTRRTSLASQRRDRP